MRLPIRALLLLLASIPPLFAEPPWQPEEFPVFYWFGPPSAFNTREHWQQVKACNFTVTGPSGYGIRENRKLLGFCRELGLKALISDPRLNAEMVAEQDWTDTLAKVVTDYALEPAFYGYYLQDEPNSELFPALAQLNMELQRRDPKHLPFINLFPTYANSAQLGSPTYADHLEKYLLTVKPAVLCYDHYALMKGGWDRADYFENLELIREYGLRFGVPAWNILLSLSHLAYRDPNAAEMRWQVYTSLAYGIKGLGWFTYWTEKAWEKDGIGIVNSQGKPARLYPIVRQLNGEARILGNVLLRLVSTGVFHTGNVPPACRRLGSDASIQVSGNPPLLLGFFRHASGGEFVMVVNRDHGKPVECELSFRPHILSVAEVSANQSDVKPVPLSNQRARLKLEAGAGILLRLTSHFVYPQAVKLLTTLNFQFNTEGDLEGWGSLNSLSAPAVKDGVFAATFTGPDPFFSRGALHLAPGRVTRIRVRMKLPPCDPVAQLFWTTSEELDFRDDKYVHFAVKPDGAWHEYVIPVGKHSKWRGKTIRAIRLDPTTGGAAPGSKVEIDYLRGE